MASEFTPQHREPLSISLWLVMICFSIYLLLIILGVGTVIFLGIKGAILPLIILAIIVGLELLGMHKRKYWASSLGLLIAVQILGSYIVAQFGGHMSGSIILNILPAAVSLFIIVTLYREEYQFIY